VSPADGPRADASRPAGAVDADTITEILRTSRTIAVIGLSSRRMRPSYGVAEYMQRSGYPIIPVNPNETEVLGEKSYARLEDVPERVDIVDIFRRSEFVPEIVESAIRIGARVVWMQEGVMHAEAAERARKAGLMVIMNTCIAKEHARRFKSPSG
jgi:predicted CoA-binding protein